MKTPHCTLCDQEGHYKTFCTFTYKSGRKPTGGKYKKKWMTTKKKWMRENKADHYICYICGKWLTPEETTLDHIKPRGSNPELRYEMSNLAPCCYICNGIKGSRSLEAALKLKPQSIE